MKIEDKKICPCCSGELYINCCQPFHQGKLPSTALQLMRSRYSAYALCLPDYIIHTTHPKNPKFNRDIKKWSKEITEFSLSTQFNKLEILQFQEKNLVAIVTFVAYLTQNTKDVTFTELSNFEKVKGKWLYCDGQLSEGRNLDLVINQPFTEI